MFGAALNKNKSETEIMCENDASMKNSSKIESALDEKHLAVAHHFTRWSVAAEVCLVGWIPTGADAASAIIKVSQEDKRKQLFWD